MKFRFLRSLLVGSLALGAASAAARAADELADLPAFRQPVALSVELEPVAEPAAASGPRSLNRFLPKFSAFPNARQAIGQTPAAVEKKPVAEPAVADPGHSLARTTLQPPPRAAREFFPGPNLTDMLVLAPQPDSLIPAPFARTGEETALAPPAPHRDGNVQPAGAGHSLSAQPVAPATQRVVVRPTMKQKMGLAK